MDVNEILEIVYRIQGAADPNQPTSSLAERMAEIFELASQVMDRTGFMPDDVE